MRMTAGRAVFYIKAFLAESPCLSSGWCSSQLSARSLVMEELPSAHWMPMPPPHPAPVNLHLGRNLLLILASGHEQKSCMGQSRDALVGLTGQGHPHQPGSLQECVEQSPPHQLPLETRCEHEIRLSCKSLKSPG